MELAFAAVPRYPRVCQHTAKTTTFHTPMAALHTLTRHPRLRELPLSIFSFWGSLHLGATGRTPLCPGGPLLLL